MDITVWAVILYYGIRSTGGELEVCREENKGQQERDRTCNLDEWIDGAPFGKLRVWTN